MYGIRETRNIVLVRLLSLLYSAMFALSLLILLALIVFGKQLANLIFPYRHALMHLLQFRHLIAVPLLFLFFWIFYSVIPNTKTKFIRNIPGAVFATFGWVVFSWLFSIYVDHYCNYSSIYGAMTTVALIMVWLYGCVYMVFFGGILNGTIVNRHPR